MKTITKATQLASTTAPAPTSAKATTPASEGTLRTKHLAAKFGLKPTALRRVLRSMPEYADGVHTNYRWTSETDPAIGRIATAIKARQAEAAKAREEAQAKATATSKAA